MSEEEKKAIKQVTKFVKEYLNRGFFGIIKTDELNNFATILNLIQSKQKEIEKKDKIIDEMAEWIFNKDYVENSLLIARDDDYSNCIKKVKQYFEKKAEEE